MNIRAGDVVHIYKKIESEKSWRHKWGVEQEKLLLKTALVTDVRWHDGEGSGIFVRCPYSNELVSFHPNSLLTQPFGAHLTINFNAEGYGQITSERGKQIFSFKDQQTCYYLPVTFCCGLAEIGHFNFSSVEVGKRLVTLALEFCAKKRHGVARATLVGIQEIARESLVACGFKLKSSFHNPNSTRTVHEYEHREFNGNVTGL